MTVKLKAAVEEGICLIESFNLPVELNAGEWIAGDVSLVNNGGADTVAVVIITEWDGKAYGAVFILNAGERATIGIASGLITMPSQDAAITLHGCHAEPGGEVTIDGTEFKIDDTKTH